ncbi:1-(5-phosphoribosyl)-5-((5-phosphoribosylamino)methylideneamino)imidazole-4-carboxamide isomerase [Luteimonas sp. MC1782]|uniref:1-(5-phosphoribosyl)-5-[(5- phosphoribosylamino)methylideneamino]imidazole-4- carboxamide isomerase n=1 Tax=Luteimonas sp. MC1782 TaxID=2760305 RepID=UPI001603DF5D|nr:HisA/HisF-related TIM barrel protein [Luteimonas sp. MC1782]MBB1471610.1 1-(5-phosphoribosyl)-5-((5-phosphoribosylamino)methylideneamino)imidazole-4-carboxamide isomerase [Luteimonas sp. MC1782]
MRFNVYPAIDVRDGRVVRLAQGDYARESRYADAPLDLAMRYAEAGARWLHLVDLDAARAGGYTLAPLLSRIKAQTGLSVQTGGGVRSEGDVDAMLDAGADRVVIGSLAVARRDMVAGWVARHGAARIVVALDARQAADGQWRPATHGWTEDAAETLDALVAFHAGSGLQHLLCTDIGRDGMLSGPNLSLYARLRTLAPTLRLQASGGARDADDIAAARAIGCDGIVLGKALLEGRLGLHDALALDDAAASGQAPPC